MTTGDEPMLSQPADDIQQIKPVRLYYCACVQLWAVLATEYFLFENEEYESPADLGKYYVPKYGDLLEWVSDEYLDFWREVGTITHAEEQMDQLTESWLPQMWQLATSLHSQYPVDDKSKTLLALYWSSVIKALERYDQLMQERLFFDTVFSKRYVETGQAKVHEIVNLLKEIVPLQETIQANSELEALINHHADKFANIYIQLVIQRAK